MDQAIFQYISCFNQPKWIIEIQNIINIKILLYHVWQIIVIIVIVYKVILSQQRSDKTNKAKESILSV